jgi:hypothetical protein
MYAPDEGIARLDELSPKAAKLWLFFCTWRDHKTGYSRKGFDRAFEELKITRATAYRVHRELLDGDWVSETPDGRVGLRGGSFAPYDKTEEARRVWATPRGELPGERSLIFETGAENSLNSETENLSSETNRLKNETEHIEERARGSSITLSINPPSHTPPTPSLANGGGAPPDGGGVCVPMARSRFRKEQCVEWARQRKAEGGRIDDPYAVGRARWLDGTADDEIAEFIARRELVQEGRRPVEQQLMPYHVAAQMVNSVKQGGGDMAAFITNELLNVTPADKAKLRRTFLKAKEPEQRAHAPP